MKTIKPKCVVTADITCNTFTNTTTTITNAPSVFLYCWPTINAAHMHLLYLHHFFDYMRAF